MGFSDLYSPQVVGSSLGLDQVESLLEISDEIAGILNTNGDTDHVLGDASVHLLLWSHVGVSH